MFLKEYGRYWSASCQMPHIGATARHKRIDETNELAQYICEELTKRGFFIEYDLSYPGPGNTLFITEMFASNGGVMIRTAHNKFNELMVANAQSKRRDVADFVFEPKWIILVPVSACCKLFVIATE